MKKIIILTVFLAGITLKGAYDPLISAIQQNNIEQVKQILPRSNVNYTSDIVIQGESEEYSPLMAALESGSSEMVSLLLQEGANPDMRDSDGDTPLIFLLDHDKLDKNSKMELLNILLQNGADINKPGDDGETPLMIAVEEIDDPEIVNFMIKQGANVSARDNNEKQAIHKTRNPKVRDILQKNLEFQSSMRISPVKRSPVIRKQTPLLYAINNNLDDMATLLLQKGADADLPGEDGLTPLTLCLKQGKLDTAKMLLKHGANPNKKTATGDSLLMTLLKSKDMDPQYRMNAVELLLAHRVDPNGKDSSGNVPLIVAMEHLDGKSRMDVVSLLLDKGANPNRA